MKKLRSICLFIIFTFFFQGFLFSQDRYVLSKFDTELNYDGVCDEPAWDHIEPLPLMVMTPSYGHEPSEKTEIRIAYDDDYFYLGAKCFDSQPDKMKIQLKRDDWKYECDWIQLMLDTFNDKENTVLFGTSPSGGRTDVAFSNDANSLRYDMNTSWNTFWDVKTKVDNIGWQVEMRIPFSSLRFQEVNGETIMGVNVSRYISRKNEWICMPHVEEKHGNWGNMKASQCMEVVIKNIKSKKPIYIAPYILGGLEQTNLLSDDETKYDHKNDKDWNAGLDLKYRLTNNLTFDATINQDFAQIEADNQLVNLTRFSLFFPEKRLFFQERKSNFDFKFDYSNRLFYTRNIGINNGNPVGIYGGGRLVGRLGDWDVGFLSMQSAPEEELLSENFTVLRLRKQVINANSYVGGMVTNRMDFNGAYNTAYGLDGIFRLFGDDYLKVMWAQTFDNNSSNEALSLDPTRIYINWERRTQKGISYEVNYSRAGSDYNPGIGYERRTNYSLYEGSLSYGWIYDDSWLNSQSIGLTGYQYSENVNNTTETAGLVLNWNMLSASGIDGYATADLTYDRPLEDFNLADNVTIPAGDYTFYTMMVDVSTPRGRTFKVNPGFSAGTFYDGWRTSPSITTNWIIKSRIQLRATYMYDRIVFPSRNQQLNSNIFRLNTQVVFSTKLSASVFVQYNNNIDAVLTNIRIRYNPKEGNDLYLVYDEGYNTDRYRDFLVYPVTSRRTIMIKYTYTFIL